MEMPGRKWQASNYRYSHNGHEKEEEIFSGANSAEFWMYDSRIGRRWEIDPITYAWQSPYACFNNNSIYFDDPKGLKGDPPIKKGDKIDLGNGQSTIAMTDEVVVTASKTGFLSKVGNFFRRIGDAIAGFFDRNSYGSGKNGGNFDREANRTNKKKSIDLKDMSEMLGDIKPNSFKDFISTHPMSKRGTTHKSGESKDKATEKAWEESRKLAAGEELDKPKPKLGVTTAEKILNGQASPKISPEPDSTILWHNETTSKGEKIIVQTFQAKGVKGEQDNVKGIHGSVTQVNLQK